MAIRWGKTPGVRWAAGFFWLAAFVYAPQALAYCRTTTLCHPDTQCDGVCPDGGPALFWKRSCVSYSVQRDASPARSIDYRTIHDIVERAFDRWTNADCAGNLPSLTTLDLSPVDCDQPEYNSTTHNANVIMFHDDEWSYEKPGATLALTVVTFNTETGEIYDADMEVNSFKTPLTTSDSAVGFDLESIITHEAGHFLGLAHSRIDGATMSTPYQRGDLTFRDLSLDDEAGMCAVYPPTRDAPAGDCRPRHGFSSECGEPPSDAGCACRAAPEGSAPTWPLVALLAISVPLGFRRLRKAGHA